MAKIGNEAKLILRLAEDRAKDRADAVCNVHGEDDPYAEGFGDGVQEYMDMLSNIVKDLEAKY